MKRLRLKEYEIFESTGASPELLRKCKLSYEAGNNGEGGISGEIDGNIIKLFQKNPFGVTSEQGYRYEGEINTIKIEDEEDAKSLYTKYVEVAKMQSGEHGFEAMKKLDKELIDKLLSL